MIRKCVFFFITGSHVTFVADTGDGNRNDSVYIITSPKSVTFYHQYASVGNYTVTVSASNQLANLTDTCEVIVQNPVPALTLTTTPAGPYYQVGLLITPPKTFKYILQC